MKLIDGQKTINNIVIPYKYFNTYDYLSLCVSIIMWKENYSQDAQMYLVCDKQTINILKDNQIPYADTIKFINYNQTIQKIYEKFHKNAKTYLLNEEILLLNDLLNKEPFIFASDDRFPIAPIDDGFLNRQHKILGKYPKWNFSRKSNWRKMMNNGCEFIKNKYNEKHPVIFKNHYFTTYDNEFIKWFKQYMYKYDLSQMRTLYNLYVKKDKTIKDVYKQEIIETTREFGIVNKIDLTKRGKTLFGLSVSKPEFDVKLLQQLLIGTKVRKKDKEIIDNLFKIKGKDDNRNEGKRIYK